MLVLGRCAVNHAPCIAVACLRRRLASAQFYDRLSHVRSMQRMPSENLLEVLRDLLWKETIPVHSLDSAFVRKLASYGQAYLDPSGL